MFERFVTRARCLQSHRTGPMRRERERYLRHLLDEGRAPQTLAQIVGYILHAAVLLDLGPGQTVGEARLATLGQQWRDGDFRGGRGRAKPSARTVRTFLRRVRRWLAFCGRIERPAAAAAGPFEGLLRRFLDFHRAEHGWSPTTVGIYRRDVGLFLAWWAAEHGGVGLDRLDARALTDYARRPRFARWSRCSIAGHVCHVRVFLRWLGGRRGGCGPSLWQCLDAPRLYRLERYPQGPTWEQVRALLDAADTARPLDLRDRAMMMLLAVYGLRSGEVRALRLEDVDWDNGIVRPPRPKGRRVGTYPLAGAVGDALIAYLKVRPACRHRHVFISALQPYRPLRSSGSLSSVVRGRQKALGQRMKRYGPHGLRHACATRLLAEGFTLKQIGDQLGHASVEATEIYAKVDAPGLAAVGDVSLGELVAFDEACERRTARRPDRFCATRCARQSLCKMRGRT